MKRSVSIALLFVSQVSMWIAIAFMWLCILLAGSARSDVMFLAAPVTRDVQGRTNSATQSVSINDGPYQIKPEAQLIIRTPEGRERVLIAAGGVDFTVQNKTTVLVSIFENNQTDLWRLNIATGALERITNTPNEWECQPIAMINGRIGYLSNRDGWRNPKAPYRAFTVYTCNKDGREVQRVWHAGLGGVFGLFFGPDGRLYFSSGENQGLKPKAGMNWIEWSINPDGSEFNPEISAAPKDPGFGPPADWGVITTDGTFVWAYYYNTRRYGTIDFAPKFIPGIGAPPTPFGHPLWTENPALPMGYDKDGGGDTRDKWGYMRRGQYTLRWATHADIENKNPLGEKPGMVSHPWPIPNNGIYLTWTGDKGDVNIDLGVYAIPDVKKPPGTHKELVKVVDELGRHEWMGKEVCTFEAIYGFAEAPDRSIQATVVSSESAGQLPKGSPYGEVSSASVDLGESVKGHPQDAMVAMWPTPGDSAAYLRVVSFNPTTMGSPDYELIRNGPPQNERHVNNEGFFSFGNERMGEYIPLIPLRKYRNKDGLLHMGANPPAGYERVKRKDGRQDTSFKFQIPGNQPWSFQLLNDRKEPLPGFSAQTWHQVIPGEIRTCGGCHNHWQPDALSIAETEAGRSDYPVYRLKTIRTVVYERDIAPLNLGIEQRPWDRTDSNQHYPFSDTLTKNMPQSPSQELVALWQALMFPAAGKYKGALITPASNRGPYADTIGPTNEITILPDGRAVVGMCDPQAGLDMASFKFTVDGQDRTSTLIANLSEEIWTTPSAVHGTLVSTVKDKHGNQTTRERIVSLAPPPPVELKPTAKFIGFDVDRVGQGRSKLPNGTPDYHFIVSNVRKSRPILFVDWKATVGSVTKTWGDRAVGETTQNPDGTSAIISMIPHLAGDAAGNMDVAFEPIPGFVPERVRCYLNYTEKGTSGVEGVDYDAILAIPVSPPPAPPPADDVAKLREQLAALQAQLTTLTAERDALKAQGTADAATIAKMTADVASLKADVDKLADQLKARVK